MKKFLFLPFAAALALAGCSDSTTEGPENGLWTGEGTGYLAVTISAPTNNPNLSTSSTRATDKGYEVGDYNERFAPYGLFLLFDSNGQQIGNPQLVDLNPWTNENLSNPEVDRISSAVIVIGGTDGVKKVVPNRVVCILNAPDGLSTRLTGKSITEIRSVIEDYSFQGAPINPDEHPGATRGSIVQSNSVYLNSNNGEEFAANISAHIATTQATAKLNPVNIYVERLVAKIRVGALTEEQVSNTEISMTRNGVIEEKVEIRPVLKAVALGNVADKSYLFKNIAGLSFTDWTTWNDPTNKRCYWAVSPSTTATTNPLGFINKSWNEMIDPALGQPTRYYIQENTSSTPTCVMLKAELHEVKDGVVSDTPLNLCKLAGLYYTPDDALKLMATYAQNAGWCYQSTVDGKTVYTSIQPTDLRWMTKEEANTDDLKDLKGWEAVARFKKTQDELTTAGLTLVKERLSGDNMIYDTKTIADLNQAMLAPQYHAWMWTKGCTYYFVDIEHFGFENETITTESSSETKQVFLKGVVRNHAYDLTLNSVKNLGVPVFDPDEKIIPEKPSEDAFFVAAQINVLKWKLVGQTVDFE